MDHKNHSTHMDQFSGLFQDPEFIRKKLVAMANGVGIDNFRKKSAREIVAATEPERAIPEVYGPYRDLVRDGIQFFLSRISFDRLLDVMVRQLCMDRQSTAQERLLELAKQFPTLHKLGQIIARNPNLDSEIKQWLIHLENGNYGTDPHELVAHIQERLAQRDDDHRVRIEAVILAEASVGAVIPFRRGNENQGVFKVLKKRIRSKLGEELGIFMKMASFFEDNRQDYALKDFRFLEVFDDVQSILLRELNLEAEQAHLGEAAGFYEDTHEIVIPDVMPLSDQTMTAMSYIDGPKITDADLTRIQRQACARTLVASLICRPIFAADDPALFHGDPHAGNILWAGQGGSNRPKIALLDWSLAGHLARGVRIKIVGLIKGIIMDDPGRVCRAVQQLCKRGTGKGSMSRSLMYRRVSKLMLSKDYASFPFIKKAFWILEQFSYDGVVFPRDLMLFRKAIFTLDGVLFDLDPSFDMDAFVLRHMAGLIAEEMPRRFGNLLFFQADKPDSYKSLLTNGDLQMMMLNQYTAAVKRNAKAGLDLFEKQTRIMRLLFN